MKISIVLKIDLSSMPTITDISRIL
jgi:hypothetical protein